MDEEDGAVTRCPEYPEFRQLERRPFRPFKSSEEYLYAMKEDLAEWLNTLYDGLDLTAENFLERLETGVTLCRHANSVRKAAIEWQKESRYVPPAHVPPIPHSDVIYRTGVQPGTFQARDNVSNFISWCRALNILDCLLFETDDLVLRKNEKSFILCLLEVARQGTKFGMLAPLLVQMEQEIDEELARDQQKAEGDSDEGHDADDDDSSDNAEPPPQVITNDLKSLHEMVKDLLYRCTCPSQFPMIRVSEGKYRIGDTKVLIFVRILRNHVMVRVGGGWDTLDHYLDKHDPCRCRSGHRLSTSAKLNVVQHKTGSSQMHVTYNRSPAGSTPGGGKNTPQMPGSPHRTRRPNVSEKQKFSKTIRFPDQPEEDLQRRRGVNNRPLSQLSDESSASSVGMPAVPRHINGTATIGNDSSSEFSENEARVGSWVAGVQARKCSPRKVLKIDSDQNTQNLADDVEKSNHEKVIRYSSDCSSVLSPDDGPMQNLSQESPASPKTLTGNGSDSSGIDVSCENLQEIDRSKLSSVKPGEILKNSKIPTPKADSKSKIPSIVKTPVSTGMKRNVRIKSQSSDSLNCQSNFNRKSDSSRPDNLTPNNPSRRRSTSQVMSAPTTRMPRSRSASGEGLAQSYNLSREGPGRFSYRTPRGNDSGSRTEITCGNKTWTFRQRNNRPTLSYETYMNPTTASQQRRVSSESPKRRIPLRSADNSSKTTPVKKVSHSASTSPTREISPLLQEILSNENDLSDDTKILQKMEMIVNQYKARVEANLKKKESKENEKSHLRWNSTGDLSDEGFLNTKASSVPRKLSAPPSPVSIIDPIQNLDISARPRRDSLGPASNSKIPMPRWYTKKL